MLDMTVTTEGEVRDKLYEYSKHFPKIKNYMIAEVSKQLAKYEKERYLNGQYLARRTGTTYNSVKFFKMKNGVFGVRPGAGVPGRLNYLNVYVQGYDSLGRTFPQGNFVRDAAAAYFSSGEPIRIAEGIAQKTLIARFKGGLR
ncbi:MAG: hypothetical protein AVO39_10940 [delta proteobacterium MLS_D]|jgi:hypothetical protein|nr:MAG: hypothetical protein AVO39_10940 [delta proteobacterium MLS_D]